MKKETSEKIDKIVSKISTVLTIILIVMSPFVEAIEVYKICNAAEGAKLYWDICLLSFYGSFPCWCCLWIYKAYKEANYKLGYVLGFFEAIEKRAKEEMGKEIEDVQKEDKNV